MQLSDLKNKNIHIIGVSGNEGSAILSFLSKHDIEYVTLHDFIPSQDIEKNFKLWHKGIKESEKEVLWKEFQIYLKKYKCFFGDDYLKNIENADIIFVPQSWRLYARNNKLLNLSQSKKIPFYSLTRLYLEFSKAKVVAVTGTVGKGSVASILYQLLRSQGVPLQGQVYFGGNETWMMQVADKLDIMTQKDILILEISHRQLIDGISKGPNIAIFTNLYPNHLDEITWNEYKKIKFSLFQSQKESDISILNCDDENIKEVIPSLESRIIYYSEKNKEMNTKNIQKIFEEITNTKSTQYPINVLAASTVADELGLEYQDIRRSLHSLSTLPARKELIKITGGVKIYNDIKSTTPWATLKAVESLGSDIVLICGGDTKGIDYEEFISSIKRKVKYVVPILSNLSNLLTKCLPRNKYSLSGNLRDALEIAYQKAQSGDSILISPAAAFFYTKFIAGKTSLRKLVTSLPPKEIV